MALRDEFENGKIEILSDGTLQIRRDRVIKDDDTELARTYHRVALAAGDSLDGQTDEVKAIAAIVWTPERIEAARERRRKAANLGREQ